MGNHSVRTYDGNKKEKKSNVSGECVQLVGCADDVTVVRAAECVRACGAEPVGIP